MDAIGAVAGTAMDSEELCDTLREMLSPGVCVAAGAAVATPLTAREHSSLGFADAERVREFANGRAYAKRALAILGMPNVDLPIGPNRAPVWPKGVVGSITHVRDGRCGTYAAAAVARADAVVAVGIDFEMENSIHPHVWRHVLTKPELERILSLPVEARRTEAQYIWCAKEATAKIVQQPLDPTEVEVERDPTSGDFKVNVADNNRFFLRSRLLGRTARLDRLLIATAVLPREMN
jgi:4'-phosphopantetheinyl transferase EntD